MESLPFATWFKDENGKFIQVNELFLTTLGKERFQVIGRRDKAVFDQEEAKQIEEGEREVHKTGRISESTYSSKY